MTTLDFARTERLRTEIRLEQAKRKPNVPMSEIVCLTDKVERWKEIERILEKYEDCDS